MSQRPILSGTWSIHPWRRILPVLMLVFLAMTDHAGAQTNKSDLPHVFEPCDRSGFTETLKRVSEGFSFHRENYAVPLTWSNIATHSADSEFIFQISGKVQLFGTGFHAAYTQKSFWRVLDGDDSRPFRETNYNPEFFYRLVPEKNPLGCWGINLGYEHESNGSREPTSRSWDRLYVAPYLELNHFRADLKIWYRIPEDDKAYEGDPAGDENPDIIDYYGHGQLSLRYEWTSPNWMNHHMVHIMARLNPKTQKGAVQFQYSVPFPGQNFFVFFHLWSGYGESLIDYNHSITRYGIGVMLKR